MEQTTQEKITGRLISAYQNVLTTGNPSDRRLALRKLIEIAQACPYRELASRAHKILVSFRTPDRSTP